MNRNLQKGPAVSVILPIRNEGKSIASCVQSLLQQDYPPELVEILIVDGMSEDDTRAILKKIIQEVPGRIIRVLDNPKKVVSPALNIGIRSAIADVVIRMDGHTGADKTYISCCVKALLETGAANVGGVIRYVGNSQFGQAVALAQSHVLGAGNAKFHYAKTPGFVDTVFMGAFNKEIFSRVGLFDESMIRNQDYEMNIRIRKTGEKIYLDPAIISNYTSRDTPFTLWKQYFEYGWWKVETLRRHPESLLWRQFVPVLFVASFLGLTALSSMDWARALLAGQLMIYLVTIGSAAWKLYRRAKEVPSRHLLFVFALMIMHFSWGCGFLLNFVSAGRFPYKASPPCIPTLS